MALSIIDSSPSYVYVIGKTRQKIFLKDLEVESTLIRRAATDGLIIQVPEDNARKAEKLAALKRVKMKIKLKIIS